MGAEILHQTGRGLHRRRNGATGETDGPCGSDHFGRQGNRCRKIRCLREGGGRHYEKPRRNGTRCFKSDEQEAMIEIPGRIPLAIHPFFWVFAAMIGWLNSGTMMGTLIWVGIILVSVV